MKVALIHFGVGLRILKVLRSQTILLSKTSLWHEHCIFALSKKNPRGHSQREKVISSCFKSNSWFGDKKKLFRLLVWRFFKLFDNVIFSFFAEDRKVNVKFVHHRPTFWVCWTSSSSPVDFAPSVLLNWAWIIEGTMPNLWPTATAESPYVCPGNRWTDSSVMVQLGVDSTHILTRIRSEGTRDGCSSSLMWWAKTPMVNAIWYGTESIHPP